MEGILGQGSATIVGSDIKNFMMGCESSSRRLSICQSNVTRCKTGIEAKSRNGSKVEVGIADSRVIGYSVCGVRVEAGSAVIVSTVFQSRIDSHSPAIVGLSTEVRLDGVCVDSAGCVIEGVRVLNMSNCCFRSLRTVAVANVSFKIDDVNENFECNRSCENEKISESLRNNCDRIGLPEHRTAQPTATKVYTPRATPSQVFEGSAVGDFSYKGHASKGFAMTAIAAISGVFKGTRLFRSEVDQASADIGQSETGKGSAHFPGSAVLTATATMTKFSGPAMSKTPSGTASRGFASSAIFGKSRTLIFGFIVSAPPIVDQDSGSARTRAVVAANVGVAILVVAVFLFIFLTKRRRNQENIEGETVMETTTIGENEAYMSEYGLSDGARAMEDDEESDLLRTARDRKQEYHSGVENASEYNPEELDADEAN
jgi:hypothetical protein